MNRFWTIFATTTIVAGVANHPTTGRENLTGEWPMTGHDSRHLAQAELPANMTQQPQEVGSYHPGRRPLGNVICADVDDDGQVEVLYGTSPLVCRTLSGKVKWSCYGGSPLAIADIDGDGTTELLTNACMIVSGKDGKIVWRRSGPGSVGQRIMLSQLLPEVKGQQVALISTDYGEMTKYGQVWSFEDGFEDARLVWERGFATWEHAAGAVGQWDQNTTCLVAPTWGGFYALDARDGSELMRLYWASSSGKSGLRNYGPLTLTDLDGDGKSEFVIMAQQVSQHVNVFAPWRGTSEQHATPDKPWPTPQQQPGDLASYESGPLLWQRDFGKSYPTGDYVFDVPTPHIADVDGDGRQEIIAAVGKGVWESKVYDGMTGEEKASLPDLEIEGAVDFDGDGVAELFATSDGALVIGTVADRKWAEQLRLPKCRIVRSATSVTGKVASEPTKLELLPASVTTSQGRAWVAVQDELGDRQTDVIVLMRPAADGSYAISKTPVKGLSGLSVLGATGEYLVTTTSDGAMHVMRPDGAVKSSWEASGPYVAGISVADIDGDGQNEAVACRADDKVAALKWNNEKAAFDELWRAHGRGLSSRSEVPQPVIVDVNGDGKNEILVAGHTSGGEPGVQLLSSEGKLIWENDVPAFVATYGDFNGDGHLDFYLGANVEGAGSIGRHMQSFVINGVDGKTIWRNDGAADKVWHRQMAPTHQMPTVVDVNDDGCDDIMLVALDLCTVLDGRNGNFLQEPTIANTIWQQMDGKDTQWTAYGIQIPIDVDGDGELEVLMVGTWGQLGAWSLSDRKFLWTVDPGKSELARHTPGIADVDGDGQLEIGALHQGGIFRCYNAANGNLKWELPGLTTICEVVTADVDNDQISEFLVGGTCIEATSQHEGKIVWNVPSQSSSSPVVADIDNDGLSELIYSCHDGLIRIFE